MVSNPRPNQLQLSHEERLYGALYSFIHAMAEEIREELASNTLASDPANSDNTKSNELTLPGDSITLTGHEQIQE